MHYPGIEPGSHGWQPWILTIKLAVHYAATRDRTRDLQIFSLTLSQLSYRGVIDEVTKFSYQARLAEWSKASRSGRDLVRGVGSNPTTCIWLNGRVV